MTGETLERVTALDEDPLYRCTECGGESATRMPSHEDDCPVIADGGEADAYEFPPLHVGDHVQDRGDNEATMVVVGKQPGAADEYDVDGWGTVADYNQDYPSDDDVIEVVFPDRTTADIEAPDRYAYPRSRLEQVAPVHDLEDDSQEGDD